MKVHIFHCSCSHQDESRLLSVLRQLGNKLDTIALNQERIMGQNEEIQREVEDLRTALGVIGDGVSTLTSNLATATTLIGELRENDVEPETVAQLTRAVDAAQEIADRLTSAADPNLPTPTDETPAPVDVTVPAEGEDVTPAPAPEDDVQEESELADPGVVAEDPESVRSDENTPS